MKKNKSKNDTKGLTRLGGDVRRRMDKRTLYRVVTRRGTNLRLI